MGIKTTVSLISIAVILLCSSAWLNYTHLTEAFGSGPPYYARTTNMDKWTNPVPVLVIIDTITVLAVALLMKLGLRNIKKPAVSIPRDEHE